MAYDEKLCNEKHLNIEKVLDDHKVRLDGHSKRLDALDIENSSLKTEMKNVCLKIESLINTIKWGLGIFVTIALFILAKK